MPLHTEDNALRQVQANSGLLSKEKKKEERKKNATSQEMDCGEVGLCVPVENFSPRDTVLPRRKASFFFQ